MSLEHQERRKWVEEIAKINKRLNDATEAGSRELWH